MPDFTKEQLMAIEKSGTNIVVSAGAGSGKTEVLSERVIYKLQQGIKVNELLILTFTNAAALEMKDRIRKKILKYPEILANLDYLESAYITTFDSFTLSLVKKYHYLINVSPHLGIIDDSIIKIVKEQILDQIFEEYYAKDNPLFQKLLNDLTNKNDTELKSSLLRVCASLERLTDLDSYLDNYLHTYLSNEKIDIYIQEYLNLIFKEIDGIMDNLMYLETSMYNDFYIAMVNSLDALIKARDYDTIRRSIYVTLPRRPKGSEDIKEYKDNIEKHLDKIKGYLNYTSENEIRETFTITKDYLVTIIEIIKEYFKRCQAYKNNLDLYEFNDISLMAIKLLKENPLIREELKDTFHEILVDEYQDNNDIQEEFISLIQNNNVYMVGDVKQSIYGFRNANPQIFKQKYDAYALNKGGIKIDLLKNFRSRSEVLQGINRLFSLIMDDEVGNANYIKDHQMEAGNNIYDLKNPKQNYNLEIYNYDSEGEILSNTEIEAFIIGRDILKKIEDKYQIIDKESKKLRPVTYQDFCIIMDRGTSFPTIKKIFEYLGIPLTIYEDKKLTSEMDIILINNIIGLILKIQDNLKDIDFKYYFVSIARSFLFQYSDKQIFKIIKNNSYEETDIYKLCQDILKKIDYLDNYELLNEILDTFNFYEKTILIGDIESIMVRIDNLLTISKNLSSMGYTIRMFKEYLDIMINSKNEIKYQVGNHNNGGVKIMNIHKSKGLEFPICYFCGYFKKFNIEDIKDRFLFDNQYGIIVPFFKEGVGETIIKTLFKEKYYLKNISEEIRLFYTALTRAKEKIIIVAPLNEEKSYAKNLVDINIRTAYKSFLDILNSISGNIEDYITLIDLSNYHLTKDYLYEKKDKEIIKGKDIKINYYTLDIPNKVKEEKKASKSVNELITEEKRELFKTGTSIHKIFEQTNFLNVPNDNPYKKQIENLAKKLNITKDTQVYKEYEFINVEDGTFYRGIIDLVVVNKDIVKIIDYKLKNIDDEKYYSQLKIYYDYLKQIFKQDIKVYLYSILNDELKEIEIEKC